MHCPVKNSCCVSSDCYCLCSKHALHFILNLFLLQDTKALHKCTLIKYMSQLLARTEYKTKNKLKAKETAKLLTAILKKNISVDKAEKVIESIINF